MTLPAYRPETVCPKCGETKVATSFQPLGKNPYCTTYVRCDELGAEPADCPCLAPDCMVTAIAEHHHRVCSRCAFAWPEAVLAPAPAREAEPAEVRP